MGRRCGGLSYVVFLLLLILVLVLGAAACDEDSSSAGPVQTPPASGGSTAPAPDATGSALSGTSEPTVPTTVVTGPGPSASASVTTLTTSLPPGKPSGAPDVQAAVEVAQAVVPGGAVIEVEREHHQGRPAWEVLVRTADARGVEIYVDAATGDVLKQEAEELPPYVQASAPAVDISTALDRALAAYPGVVEEVELERRAGGRLMWEVEIVGTNGRSVEVYVDAGTGEVIR